MTKVEFLSKVPDIINHSAHGYGVLEILSDTQGEKGICYRHKDKVASGGNYASTWEELYIKVIKYLKESVCVQ